MYRDFSLKEPVLLEGDKAILQAIKNLIFTKVGERFFNPRFGVELDDLIGELDTMEFTFFAQKLEDDIKRLEPRIKEVKVTLLPIEEDPHAIALNIQGVLENGADIDENLTFRLGG